MKISDQSGVVAMLPALLRVALGIVFIYAAAGKITDPEMFAGSIGNYKVFAPTTALVAATVVPWIELLCGIGLLLGVWSRGCSLLTSFMLVIFTGFVLSAMVRGLDISCGCFTQDPLAEKVGWRKVTENLVFLVMSIVAFRSPATALSLEHKLLRK